MNSLIELLHIKYPIIQAPMAGGITTSNLVSAVSNAGGLGMIGAGYMDAVQLQKQIKEVKERTSKSFGVNLFIPQEAPINELDLEKAYAILQPYRDELDINNGIPSISNANQFAAQLDVIIEEKVPVVSFTFGLPSSETIKMLKNQGIIVIGTATTVNEAVMNEESRMDAVVVQGCEAGGHRGSFTSEGMNSLIGLMSLIPQTVDQLSIPVIATGGIMDGRGVTAALSLGAVAAQLGTAFLMCHESGAHNLHKDAILAAHEDQVVLTKAFSGKLARGIHNLFIENMKAHEAKLLPYPIQNTLTSDIRKAAAKQNKDQYMSLWSGQSPRLSTKQSVAELFNTIISQMNELHRNHNIAH